ncbi:unnamed protein product [Oikopleura dioica]|uniref:Uncharacterized protein n=1 Tax=Oikopleura dioica TaxID=34765 RepID=E4XNF7_OIKDI|nr:unnamed protein product [Oikopleura dioica]CBY40681.1 unnamed protein product [Oikopleura dioica]
MIMREKPKILILFLSQICNAQLELEENLVPVSSDNLWSLSLTTEGTPLTTTTAEQRATTEKDQEKSTKRINENIDKTTTFQVLAPVDEIPKSGNLLYRRERVRAQIKALYQNNKYLKNEIERISIRLNNTKIFADEKEKLRLEQIRKLEEDLEEARQDYYAKLDENGALDKMLRVAKGRVEALMGENLMLVKNITDFKSNSSSFRREKQIRELEMKRLLMSCEEKGVIRENELTSWKNRNERFEQNNRDLINQNKLIRDQIISTTDELDRCRQKEKLFERSCNCESYRIQANSCQVKSSWLEAVNHQQELNFETTKQNKGFGIN